MRRDRKINSAQNDFPEDENHIWADNLYQKFATLLQWCMDQIFHSWCMGSNLGNLDPGSPEDGDWWVGQSFKKQLLGRIVDIKSFVDDQTLSGSESLWVWFQPQVWFHSWWRLVWAGSSVVGWEEFCSGGGNWWIPCIIQPLTIPRQRCPAHLD